MRITQTWQCFRYEAQICHDWDELSGKMSIIVKQKKA